ncbi:MAG TPA: DUF3656 domain-containing protein, partial [Geobacteraceae bacterium]
LHVGDRIRVQPKTDMAGRAFTVREIFVANRPVKAAPERSLVTVVAPFPVKAGDAIFKVSSETAFTMSENACLKRLEAQGPAKLPCDLTCGLAGERLVVAARVAGRTFEFEFPLGPLEPARTSDMAGVLAAQFGRCGETPFVLASLAAPDFPALLIPPARLKEIRRDFYRQLEAVVLPELRAERQRAKERALACLAGRRPPAAGRSETIVRIEQLRDWHLLHQEGVSALSLPVSRANLHQLPQTARKLRGVVGQIIWRLPFIIFEADIPFYREALVVIRSYGFCRFEAANLGHFPLLREAGTGYKPATADDAGTGGSRTSPAPVEISTDYRLFSLNSQALLAWRELGAVAATLYVEDDAGNLAALLAADVPIARRVLVYGGIPVITSKIAIRGVKSDAPIVSDRGDAYQVTVRDGLTVVTAEQRFSLTGRRGELQQLGCSGFILDLGGLPPAEWPRILGAFGRGTDIPGTSPFNFDLGLV